VTDTPQDPDREAGDNDDDNEPDPGEGDGRDDDSRPGALLPARPGNSPDEPGC